VERMAVGLKMELLLVVEEAVYISGAQRITLVDILTYRRWRWWLMISSIMLSTFWFVLTTHRREELRSFIRIDTTSWSHSVRELAQGRCRDSWESLLIAKLRGDGIDVSRSR
jgi:hypothetical protein